MTNEALKPFARFMDVLETMGSLTPRSGPYMCIETAKAGEAVLTVEDFRRAREAYAAVAHQPTVSPAEQVGEWIEWAGGKNPIPAMIGKRVDVRWRDGAVSRNIRLTAGTRWAHIGTSGDIIAYRVLPTPPAEGSVS